MAGKAFWKGSDKGCRCLVGQRVGGGVMVTHFSVSCEEKELLRLAGKHLAMNEMRLVIVNGIRALGGGVCVCVWGWGMQCRTGVTFLCCGRCTGGGCGFGCGGRLVSMGTGIIG